MKRFAGFLLAFATVAAAVVAQTNQPFDGRPWNISSGNLSVSFIKASPIGAAPKTNYLEAPPSVESQVHLRNLGLVANEDYVAWGAVERAPGKWSWEQHDAMEETLHRAGLKYAAYNWIQFPPVWLRDQQKEDRTLMRCLEHGQEANYLSIFDPRTLEWYDHFYWNLHAHFGSRLDEVYACILGPYGEGNYPLAVPDWVNMGHCHEGYWCGDVFARRAFQAAMKRRYGKIGKLNKAWEKNFRSFEEIQPPAELQIPPDASGQSLAPAGGGRNHLQVPFKPSPAVFSTPQERRRWLDFITWYHQAIIDFAERSIQVVLKYYPAAKVRLKPGGSSGGVNPLAWGTYCPGYAKMARPYHIVLQPADCQGAVFADKWVGTAYQFYGIKECTEPAGGLADKTFVRRMFSDASCGASQFFSYEYEQHAAATQKYIGLFTGKAGQTEVAVYYPTTLYRLGGALQLTIQAGAALRDLCEFDVLDELLIADGALSGECYRALIMFQADMVEQAILERIEAFQRAGGKVIVAGTGPVRNVEGQAWAGAARVSRISLPGADEAWLKELSAQVAGYRGVDGQLDGLWTCRRRDRVFIFNSTEKTVTTKSEGETVSLPPYTIWMK